MNQDNVNYVQEDEIDLKELIKTVLKYKKFIVIFTLLVTLAAGAYAFLKTPTYEVQALIEIGSYKANDGTTTVSVDNINELATKLTTLYIDRLKNEKNKKSSIESITIPKGSTTYLNVKAFGLSNKLAEQEINNMLSFVQEKHNEVLENVKKQKKLQIQTINEQINNLKNTQIPLLNERIKLVETSLRDFKKQQQSDSLNIQKIEQANPSLTALKLMEKKDLTEATLDLSQKLIDLQNQKDQLLVVNLPSMEQKKENLESMLLPFNYKNTQIVGNIITKDYPTKPKKKLIVIVAFLTGFILSIFLVFFMEFVKGLKEEEKVS